MRRYYCPVIQGDATIQGRYCFSNLWGRFCYSGPDLLLPKGGDIAIGVEILLLGPERYCYPAERPFCCPRLDIVIKGKDNAILLGGGE